MTTNTETTKTMRIFISYGRDAHVSLAFRLRDDLRKRGHEVWFDEECLQPGHDWEAFIEKGLEHLAADKANAAVILLLMPHSVRLPDGHCLNEVARALALGLRIIPLMVVEKEPPLSACRIQWLDMRQCLPIHEREPLYQPRYERLLKALEKNQLDFEGNQQRLLNALQPIAFSADILKLLKDFTGWEWVFKEVDAWLQNPEASKIFWITGSPGAGKSTIAAWIREERREIAAFHFCDINSEEKRNPAKMVRSIAYQLSTQLPEYEARLARLPLEAIVRDYQEAYTLFDKLLFQPLADNFPQPNRTAVVLIDALDEATWQRRNEIVEFLSTNADKTPPWLRFLVTSRYDEAEIMPSLKRLKPYVLDTDCDQNRRDLRLLLKSHLPGITTTQVKAILERNEGMLFSVRYVVDAIKDLSLDRLDEFPRSLVDIYQKFFRRQFGADLPYYEVAITPLLQAVLAAFKPLELGFLQSLCRIASDTDFQRRLNRLGSLFPVTGDGDDATIRPFHRSLGDWFTDSAAAGNYFISASDGHKALASFCLAEYRQGAKSMSRYALRFLPSHLIAAKRWDDLVGDEATPGPLTDLLFIQAKCEAGLVHDLVKDYNAALAALPEFREENERLAKRDAAMIAYNRALREYAVVRCDWWFAKERGETRPEPPYPPLPEELRDEAQYPLPEDGSPRAARLRHFANFVSGNLVPLSQSGQDTLSIAYNWADSGPVAVQAETQIATTTKPCLRRTPRLPAPLRPQCLRTLEGHYDYVNSVSVSPDGRRAVSGSDDHAVRIWDLETGAYLHTLEGHEKPVSCVSVSPDGRFAVSGSYDRAVGVWDLETGACLRWLRGYSDVVWSVSVSPDGRRIVSGSYDQTVRVWDLETGECLRSLEGHSGGIGSVSVSPDGRRVISGSADHTIRVWDLETGTCLHTLEGHSGYVYSVSVSPDGRRAVSGSEDKTVRVWDLETGQCLAVYHAGADVDSAAISSNGSRIVCGTSDGQMHFLTPVNFPPPEPPLITAVRLWRFGEATKLPDGTVLPVPGRRDDHLTCRCAHCGKLFEPPEPVVEIGMEGTQVIQKGLCLPDSAYANPRLLAPCPHCGGALKFNPFVVDSR
ncbi:MAG: TIR domain-containing protein [Lentisphaerae bacterium]|nr:TIR domain-containing protein [Lentisphaerota bacterium]